MINEAAGAEYSRDAGRLDRGKYVDLTKRFRDSYEPKYKDFQEGMTKVFG